MPEIELTPTRRPNRTARRGAVAALFAGAVTAAILPSVGGASQAAAPSSLDAATVAALVAATPSEPAPGRAWIQGVVIDQAGRPLDGIQVSATSTVHPEDGPVASWLTYAAPADGPQHGFFRLYVPRGKAATYDIDFSSPTDAADPYRARSLPDAVDVGRGSRTGLIVKTGPVVMRLQRQAAARVSLDPSRNVTRPGSDATLATEVVSREVDPVTGRLQLEVDGRERGVRTLTAQSHGRAVFALPDLRPGRHTLAVSYAGSRDVRAARSTTTVRVEQPPHHGSGHGEGHGHGR